MPAAAAIFRGELSSKQRIARDAPSSRSEPRPRGGSAERSRQRRARSRGSKHVNEVRTLELGWSSDLHRNATILTKWNHFVFDGRLAEVSSVGLCEWCGRNVSKCAV